MVAVSPLEDGALDRRESPDVMSGRIDSQPLRRAPIQAQRERRAGVVATPAHFVWSTLTHMQVVAAAQAEQ